MENLIKSGFQYVLNDTSTSVDNHRNIHIYTRFDLVLILQSGLNVRKKRMCTLTDVVIRISTVYRNPAVSKKRMYKYRRAKEMITRWLYHRIGSC